jgi:hypothetical protein
MRKKHFWLGYSMRVSFLLNHKYRLQRINNRRHDKKIKIVETKVSLRTMRYALAIELKVY